MPIEYDRLNGAYSTLRTLRQAFLDGLITKDEYDAQVLVIRNDIRVILDFPPPPAP